MRLLNFVFTGILASITRRSLSTIATTPKPIPICKDMSEHCAFWAAGGLCEDDLYQDDLRELCPVSCTHCESNLPVVCRNHHGQCFQYADHGYCIDYPEFMHPSCPLACGFC